LKYSTQINSDHPALAGHFPDNPIVPGAILLTLALNTFIKSQDRPCTVHSFPMAKFSSPLKPGRPIQFNFNISDNVVQFTGTSINTVIVSGQMGFSLSP
jgi:3-hydroxyacyl-[acyl-carrier-protein] dehydratase